MSFSRTQAGNSQTIEHKQLHEMQCKKVQTSKVVEIYRVFIDMIDSTLLFGSVNSNSDQ